MLDVPAPDVCYIGSDERPALESELLAWLRAYEARPAVAAGDGPVTGRRLRNARLHATGWAPAYPDYRSGYGALLAGAGV